MTRAKSNLAMARGLREHGGRVMLLSTSMLVGMAFICANSAIAACTTTAPVSGESVSCSDTSSTPIVAGGGQTGITVTVEDGAQLAVGNHAAIRLNDSSHVVLLGNGQITTTGAGNFNFGAFINDTSAAGGSSIFLLGSSSIATSGYRADGAYVKGQSGAITLNGTAHIDTQNDHAEGAYIRGNGGTFTLSGASRISTAGAYARGAMGEGNNDTITLNDNAVIATTGPGSHGAFIDGNNGTIRINGSSSITTAGSYAFGARIAGTNGLIDVGANGFIGTSGLSANAVFMENSNDVLLSYGGLATNNATAVKGVSGNEFVLLRGSGHIVAKGNLGAGISLAGASEHISLSDSSVLITTGYRGYGANIQGASGAITLNDNAQFSTLGDFSRGTNIQGNGGAISLNGNAVINTAGAYAFGAFITGNSGNVTLNGHSLISTTGSGGHGAFIDGNGAAIALNDSSAIRTSGANAFGARVTGTNSSIFVASNASIRTTGNGASAVFMELATESLTNYGTLVSTHATTVADVAGGGVGDTITNYGTIYSGSGTAVSLGAGNDTLILGQGSRIFGTVDGGAGTDTLILNGAGTDGNAFVNFENISLQGGGWLLSGVSSFSNALDVSQGLLSINGAITVPTTTIQGDGILGGSGTLTSNVTSSGTVAPGNSPGTLNIVGTFAQTGGAFDIQFDHHAMDQLNVTGAVTLSGSPTLNLIPLNGAGGASGVFLQSNTSITGSFGTVNYQGNGAGTLIQSANGITLLAVDGTPTVGAAFAASQTGLDFLDDVGAEQAAGMAGCDDDTCDRATRHLWGRGFGRFAEEGAKDGNQPFDYRIAGTAVGGDIEVANGLKIGASLGYSNTEEDVIQQAASADIDSGLAALYANYQLGRFFVTGALSGGWQSFDLARTVTSPGGNTEADATTTGWLVGTSLQAGMKFTLPNGWQLTPSAGIAWQHQWVDGYAEHGAGAGDVSIGSHQADAIRMKAQLELSQTYYPSAWVAVSPHLKVGVAEQKNFGGTAGGSFSDGTNFDLALTDNSRTIGLAGVGVDIAFADGLTTYVDYDGQLAAGRTVNAVIGGLRYSW